MTNSSRHQQLGHVNRPSLSWSGQRGSDVRKRWLLLGCCLVATAASQSVASAKGEPAEAFVKQLRNAGYFDTAINYLDRVSELPGVAPGFIAAIPLEKAQTHIESALQIRDPERRDQAFLDAENALEAFLKSGDHPRANEARLQLGKLQMIRAGQLLNGEPDDNDRAAARKSYLAANKTFDGIVSSLRSELEQMKGQKIDAQADPEAAALRDTYRFQFLQSQVNAAESIKLAAETFDDPAKEAKTQLEDAANRFAELNKKYASYIPGAIALMHLGQVNELLGKPNEALGNYLNMLEQPEADPLREAKFQAAAGLVRLKLAEEPPQFQEAIDRTGNWAKDIRPNEANLPAIQDYRIQLAKAYLARSKDDSLKKGEIGRAKESARDLLKDAKKVPGPHTEEVDSLLADLGVEQKAAELPTADPPKSLDDAMEKAQQALKITSELEQAAKLLSEQEQTPDLVQQIADIESQRLESYAVGIQILRAGLTMVSRDTNVETINEARQILAYFLYQSKRHRETVVVGSFLARHAPGSGVGLQGGLMALTSMQLLLGEVPEDEQDGLIRQLESLGSFLAKTWPDDPNAAAAQGFQIRLMLRKDNYAGAQALIDDMSDGNEKAMFKRLLGQLLWNQSIVARKEKQDQAKIDVIVQQAQQNLQQGLDEIQGNLVDTEGMQAATVLAKVYLYQDDSAAALKVLDHPKYGPLGLLKTLDAPSDTFAGDLYSTELKALVGQMLNSDKPGEQLDRMTDTMERVRGAFTGPEAQSKLTQNYMRLANDLKEQLDDAAPARKAKLIEAFSAMLKRISDSTNDMATLRWVGQTLSSMGESLMEPGQMKANGQAAELISQSIATFTALTDQDDLTTLYLTGHSQRLVGQYQAAIDSFEKLLLKNPLMLEAQMEAAQAYETWASELPPNTAYKAYKVALEGGRKGPNKKNTIWGWAEISTKTSKQINRNENFKEKFFESRYHVALCLYLMGKAAKRDVETKKAIKVIREAATLFPDLGGAEQRAKYDALMKECQRAVGESPTGLAAKVN
ncbi:hypothetical protein NHH03_23970 [Stieleria sp. TO1_6]|uniref:tetratricopeptide repeat protein n=1 Tax=Stieleria tagensis TaxID=2956795 RepID=UPI00209A9506|nr:hypothetical protein [Stieleria tagensis]MCO8124816.1 hypothetical protein [Stieleria tagensis]